VVINCWVVACVSVWCCMVQCCCGVVGCGVVGLLRCLSVCLEHVVQFRSVVLDWWLFWWRGLLQGVVWLACAVISSGVGLWVCYDGLGC